MHTRSLVIGMAAAIAACAGDGAGPDVPGPVASVTIAGDSVVSVGGAVVLQAVARDAAGRTVPGAAITWAALDTTTATVTAGGTVLGVRMGYAPVVARAAGLADTVRVRVRVPAPALGEVFLRAYGGAVTSGWGATVRYTDILATDTGEASRLVALSTSPVVDSALVVLLPGRAATGRHPIAPFPLTGPWDRSAPVVLLNAVPVGAGTPVQRVAVGGELVISRADYPAAPGLYFGEAAGYLEAPMVRVTTDGLGNPVLTSDTVRMFVEFRLHLEHLLRHNVRLTIGGPAPSTGTTSDTYAQASDDGTGGLLVWWDADMDGLPGQGYRYEASQEFRLAQRSTGVYPVQALTPLAWKASNAWPAVFSSIGFRDDPRLGLSTGGTLTITEYQAPTVPYYGRIAGTLTTTLALWQDSLTVTADTVTATVTFAVQLWPLGGIPSAPEAARDGAARPDAWRVPIRRSHAPDGMRLTALGIPARATQHRER